MTVNDPVELRLQALRERWTLMGEKFTEADVEFYRPQIVAEIAAAEFGPAAPPFTLGPMNGPSDPMDIERLGGEMREAMDALGVGKDLPESSLPPPIVVMQLQLAKLRLEDLAHVAIAACVQLAARRGGTKVPVDFAEEVLRSAERLSKDETWHELGPEVRRLSGPSWDLPEGVECVDLIGWTVGELLTLARELRMPRPVDAPSLSDALRLIAERLDQACPERP